MNKLLLLLPLIAHAQPPQSTLFRTIASLDAALFDSYNRCDLEKFGTYFADDVEFYHDKGGVILGRENLTVSVKQNICGKVRRELVPGRLEVHPIPVYGAVEMGVYRFHQPNAKPSEPTGVAMFVHLWQNKGGAWKITRAISYDHKALPR